MQRYRRAILRGLLAVMALVVVVVGTGCYSTPDSGEIGVVRNGGPFDNHKIRQVVDNGSGNTWVGWGSSTHYYPVDTQQRYFKMESCFDKDSGEVACDGADAPAVTVPTADGVEVRIEGTFYLNTGFNATKAGHSLVEDFDTQFGTRTFGGGNHAYDGNSGWSAFLGAQVEPVVANNLREVVSGVQCAELVSSCALVQNKSVAANAQQLAQKNNQSNVTRVQNAVQTGLAGDLAHTLGHPYFKNIRFNLKVVKLPKKIQGEINDTQAAFTAVSRSQANVSKARKDRDANKIKQEGYNACGACAQQDILDHLPRGITTYAPGRAFAVR